MTCRSLARGPDDNRVMDETPQRHSDESIRVTDRHTVCDTEGQRPQLMGYMEDKEGRRLAVARTGRGLMPAWQSPGEPKDAAGRHRLRRYRRPFARLGV
jgi:hypothetical protein